MNTDLKELNPEVEEIKLPVEVITDQVHNTTLCHIVRANYSPQTTEFFTPNSYSQQLGIIKYNKNESIKPHYHNVVKREVLLTQEVLFIRKGRVKVNLYDKDLHFVTSRILLQGDTILLASGGHGFEMMEDSEMLEVKQGPYSGHAADKTIFEGV
ncbi:hypothetical protein [Adhaeribacter rhizoryzae]|uniref:hypothetical protein n=1 Tax=Adhaeribacter rhizoryzae TaxID=2607907 RepID=UPI001CC1E73F|nr:hypothetical protein [Adhaeribacter rhizoryzae]